MTIDFAQPILITGGTGFAGSHLIEFLTQLGYTNLHATSWRATSQPTNCVLHQLDLTDQPAVTALLHQLQPKHIYHLAAISTVGNSFTDAASIIENNIALQLRLLQSILEAVPQARVLIVGSAQEYDVINHQHPATGLAEDHPLGPANPYGVSKVAQDLLGLSYAYAYQLDVVRARPFNHIGPRQTTDFAIPAFAQQIANAERDGFGELKVGNLTAIRDISDVQDVVAAYHLIMERGETTQVYNVGSGHGYSMQEILDTLQHLAQVPIQIVTDQSRIRPIDIPMMIANNDRIRQLGWSPKIDLTTSLTTVLNFWRGMT